MSRKVSLAKNLILTMANGTTLKLHQDRINTDSSSTEQKYNTVIDSPGNPSFGLSALQPDGSEEETSSMT